MAQDDLEPEIKDGVDAQPEDDAAVQPVRPPQKVFLGKAFEVRPDTHEASVITFVQAEDATIEDPGSVIKVNAGNTVTVHGTDAFNYYNQFALVVDPTSHPYFLGAANNLVRGENKVTFTIPKEQFREKDTFFLLLNSTTPGIRPAIFANNFIIKGKDEAAEESSEEKETQKSKQSGNDEDADEQALSGKGGKVGTFAGRVASEMSQDMLQAVADGANFNASKISKTSSSGSIDTKKLDTVQKEWKSSFESPIEIESEESVEGEVEVSSDTQVSTETTNTIQAKTQTQGTSASVTESSNIASASGGSSSGTISSQANVSAQASGQISTAIQSDERYQAIQQSIIGQWEQQNGPRWQNGKLRPEFEQFALGNGGSEPSLDQRTQSVFQQQYPQEFAGYQEQERTRIYPQATQDPALSKIESAKVEAQLNPNDEKKQQKVQSEIEQFVKQYPEKAQAYSNQVPEIGKALGTDQSSQNQGTPKEPAAANAPGNPVPASKDDAEDNIVPSPELNNTPNQKDLTPAQLDAKRIQAALKEKERNLDAVLSRGKSPIKSKAIPKGVRAPATSPDSMKEQEGDGGLEKSEESLGQPEENEEVSQSPENLSQEPQGQFESVQNPQGGLAGEPPLKKPLGDLNKQTPAPPPSQPTPGKPGTTPPVQPTGPVSAPPQEELAPLPQEQSKIAKAAEEALNSIPGAAMAESFFIDKAIWWLLGFSWAIIPIFILDIYWILFHWKNKKLFPFRVWQKVITLLLNLAVVFVIIGIIALLIKGCETLPEVFGIRSSVRFCEIADAFKHGGISGATNEIFNPNGGGAAPPAGPASVKKWSDAMVKATNAVNATALTDKRLAPLPNACVMATMVGKESGGNPYAVSTSCPSQESLKYYRIRDAVTGNWLKSPPLYDLNWNCGHAFGLIQIYIYPNTGNSRWQDLGTPSRFLFEQYHTIPQLLDPEYNLYLGGKYFSYVLGRNTNIPLTPYAQMLSPEGQKLWKAFRQYNGSGTAAENYADDSMQRYTTCLLTGN